MKRKDKGKNNSNNFKIAFKNTIYMLKIVLKEKKGRIYFALNIILTIYNIIPTIIYLLMPGMIVNELINLKREELIMAYILILLATPVITRIIYRIANAYLYKIYIAYQLKFGNQFRYHIMKMDYEIMEKPDKQDLIYNSLDICCNAFRTVDRLCSLLSSFLSLITIVSLISILNFLIVIIILVMVFINSLIAKYVKKRQFNNNLEYNKYQRYIGNFSASALMPMYAKEFRLYNIKDFFVEIINSKTKEAHKYVLDTNKTILNAQILYSITNFVQQIGIYAFLIYQVLSKNMQVGNMMIFLSATAQFTSFFSSIFNNYLEIEEQSLYINQYKELMSIPLRQYETGTKEPYINESSVIEFKNVYFKYPGSSNYVLKGVSFKLELNKSICLIGPNGSGKSTIINLLTRLYFPDSGEILLDGININEFDYEKYQELFSPVFQDFQLYPITIRENIALSTDVNIKKLESICKEVGLKSLIDKLPKKYETSIFKMYDEDGIYPSGGEAQRIAIARAIYKDGHVYLLDEPTSALDPLIEQEIYTKFKEIIKNRASIMITHRLSAVKLTDIILVINDGNVVCQGNHDELYNNNNFYKEYFDSQAQYYK